jgi:alkylation response protein AidB-like acyl-CoA dehydrogenase
MRYAQAAQTDALTKARSEGVMDLSLSDEQRLLGEASTRFIAGRYSFEHRRKILQSSEGFSRAIWNEMADLGWLGLPFAEDFGGLAGGPVEIGIVMEAIGRALMIEPYLSTIVLSGGLIDALGTADQKRSLLPKICEGKMLLAFAHAEPQSRYALEDITATATHLDGGWRLSGRKELAIGAPAADMLLVSVRIDGQQRDRTGIGVFLIPNSTAGVVRTDFPTLDGSRASDLELKDVVLGDDALLGHSQDALPFIEAVTDRAIAAICAEAVGCMEMLLKATVDYTKTRVQFGKPLAANQVLRHRMAAMAVRVEEAKASSLKATLSLDADPFLRMCAASAAKVKIGQCSRFVAEQAVQLHGGMGVTEELSVNAYFKRLLAIEMSFGSSAFHLRRHARFIHEKSAA